MKGTTVVAKMIMLIGGVVVILLLVTSVFGRGIAFGILGIAAESEPSFLQEEMRNFLTVAATTPGNASFEIPLAVNHRISLEKIGDVAYVHVKPPRGGIGAFYADPGSVAFFSNKCDFDTKEIDYNSKENQAILIKKEKSASMNCKLSIGVVMKAHADIDPPDMSAFKASSVIVAGKTVRSLTVDIKDVSSIKEIIVEVDHGGKVNNYTMTLKSGIGNYGTYNYTVPEAGSYNWKVYATDNQRNSNSSDIHTSSFV